LDIFDILESWGESFNRALDWGEDDPRLHDIPTYTPRDMGYDGTPETDLNTVSTQDLYPRDFTPFSDFLSQLAPEPEPLPELEPEWVPPQEAAPEPVPEIKIPDYRPFSQEPTDLGEKLYRSIMSGFGDFLATSASASDLFRKVVPLPEAPQKQLANAVLERLGFAPLVSQESVDIDVAEKTQELGETLREENYVEPTEWTGWESLADPEFLATTGARSLAFAAPLMAASTVAALTAPLWVPAGLPAGGAAAVSVLGAVVAPRVFESLLEAGGTYEESLARGMSDDEAVEAGKKTFIANMPLSAPDALQMLLTFPGLFKAVPLQARKAVVTNLMGQFGQKGVGAAKLLGVAGSEALEEVAQEAIGKWSLGDPVQWDKEMEQAAGIGALLGGGMYGGGTAAQRLVSQGAPPVGLSIEDVTRVDPSEAQRQWKSWRAMMERENKEFDVWSFGGEAPKRYRPQETAQLTQEQHERARDTWRNALMSDLLGGKTVPESTKAEYMKARQKLEFEGRSGKPDKSMREDWGDQYDEMVDRAKEYGLPVRGKAARAEEVASPVTTVEAPASSPVPDVAAGQMPRSPDLAAMEAETVAKQPWEMTRDEWGLKTNTRKVRFQKASTKDDVVEVSPWLALSNLRVGESFTIGRDKSFTVKSITDKTLTLVDDKGKQLRLDGLPGSPRVNSFLRDVEDELSMARTTQSYESIFRLNTKPTPKHPLLVALERDPVIQHRALVVQAIREGKPVPPEVLADYPDLAAQYGKAETVTPTEPVAPQPEPTVTPAVETQAAELLDVTPEVAAGEEVEATGAAPLAHKYWPVWEPVPGRKPWRIRDMETGENIRNKSGNVLAFESDEKASEHRDKIEATWRKQQGIDIPTNEPLPEYAEWQKMQQAAGEPVPTGTAPEVTSAIPEGGQPTSVQLAAASEARPAPDLTPEPITRQEPVGTIDSGQATTRPMAEDVSLPVDLQGAKPTYRYGDTQFDITFESDVDKALYIVQDAGKSKSDAKYMTYLRERFSGLDDTAIRDMGRTLRDSVIKPIAQEARKTDVSELTVPRTYAAEPVSPPIIEPAPTLPSVEEAMPETVTEPVPTEVTQPVPELPQEPTPEERKAARDALFEEDTAAAGKPDAPADYYAKALDWAKADEDATPFLPRLVSAYPNLSDKQVADIVREKQVINNVPAMDVTQKAGRGRRITQTPAKINDPQPVLTKVDIDNAQETVDNAAPFGNRTHITAGLDATLIAPSKPLLTRVRDFFWNLNEKFFWQDTWLSELEKKGKRSQKDLALINLDLIPQSALDMAADMASKGVVDAGKIAKAFPQLIPQQVDALVQHFTVKLPAEAVARRTVQRGAANAAERYLSKVGGYIELLKNIPTDIRDALDVYLIAMDQVDKAAIKNNPDRNWSWGTDPALIEKTIDELIMGVPERTAQTILAQLEPILGSDIFRQMDQRALIAKVGKPLGADGLAEVKRLANQLYRMKNEMLELKYETGLITKEQYDFFHDNFPHYSPIRITNYLKQASEGNPKGVTVKSNLIQHLTDEGTQKSQMSALQAYSEMVHQTFSLVMRNRTAREIARLRFMPGTEAIVKEVPIEYQVQEGTKEAEFYVFENGIRKKMLVIPEWAKAIRMDDYVLSGGMATLAKWLVSPLKWGATGANVLFLQRNMIGDMLTGFVREGVTPRQYMQAVRDVFGKQVYLTQFELGGGGLGGHGYHKFDSIPDEARAFKQSVTRLSTKEALAKFIQDMVTLKPVQDIGHKVEMLTRVATFMKRLTPEQRAAIENGTMKILDIPVEAVVAGKRVTMDFQRGGTGALVLNRFIPYFNVAFQAPVQIVRTFTEQSGPVGATLRLAAIVGLPVLLAEIWNSMFDEYEDVPQYVKNRSAIIMMPSPGKDRFGKAVPAYVEIPLREWAPVGMTIRESLRSIRKENPEMWRDMVAQTLRDQLGDERFAPVDRLAEGWRNMIPPDRTETALNAISAINPVQGSSLDSAIIGILPPILGTYFEILLNRDLYRNREIVPDDRKYLPRPEQYTQWTGEFAILMGKQLNMSPAQIEHLVMGNLAGVGKQILAGANLATQQLVPVNKGTVQPRAGDSIFAYWVPKDGDPEYYTKDKVPEIRIKAEAGEGALYVVSAKDRDEAVSKVYSKDFLHTYGVETPITTFPIVGGMVGVLYRTGGGEIDRRAKEAVDQEMGEGTVAETRRGWESARPKLDELKAEQIKLDDKLSAALISVDEWKQERRFLQTKRAATLEAIQAVLRRAALTGDKAAMYKELHATVGRAIPDRRDRIEAMTALYMAIEPGVRDDNEPDLDAFYVARNEFLTSLPAADQELVKAQLRKNATPTELRYYEAQDLYRQYLQIPRYKGVASAEKADAMYQARRRLEEIENTLPTNTPNRRLVALDALSKVDASVASLARDAFLQQDNLDRRKFWDDHPLMTEWFGKGVTDKPGLATVSVATTLAGLPKDTGIVQANVYNQYRNELARQENEYYGGGSEQVQQLVTDYGALSTEQRTAYRKANPEEYKLVQSEYDRRAKLLERPEFALYARFIQFRDSMGDYDTRKLVEKFGSKDAKEIFLSALISGDIKPTWATGTVASTEGAAKPATTTTTRTTTTTAKATTASTTKTTTTAPKVATAKAPLTRADLVGQRTGTTRRDIFFTSDGKLRRDVVVRPGLLPVAPPKPGRFIAPVREGAPFDETPYTGPDKEWAKDFEKIHGRRPTWLDYEDRLWSLDFLAKNKRPPTDAEWREQYGLKYQQIPVRLNV